METETRDLSLDEAAGRYFARGGEEDRQGVVESASGLIRYYAKLYGGACDRDDLYQTGCLALLKALDAYDPKKSASFTTYASHCIMGEIRHLVRSESSFYRPGCIKELQFRVDAALEEYVRRYGGTPPASYLAEKLNVRQESIGEVMRSGLVSFEEIDAGKIHSLAYETFRLPIEDKIALAQAARKLTALQKKVLHLLFFRNLSQQQAADELGLSQRKVSRIKEKSLEVLREEMEKNPPSEK
jgi:RNA polymerase sigma-B factor